MLILCRCTATHYPPPLACAALLCYLIPTNAATCGGPHSGRRIGPSSQSRANQIRVQQLRGKPPQYGVTGGVWQTDRPKADVLELDLKPFCRSTWETPTRASNWTRIPPCKISDIRNLCISISLFCIFLIELKGICCAESKSRVTLMSFQFCN